MSAIERFRGTSVALAMRTRLRVSTKLGSASAIRIESSLRPGRGAAPRPEESGRLRKSPRLACSSHSVRRYRLLCWRASASRRRAAFLPWTAPPRTARSWRGRRASVSRLKPRRRLSVNGNCAIPGRAADLFRIGRGTVLADRRLPGCRRSRLPCPGRQARCRISDAARRGGLPSPISAHTSWSEAGRSSSSAGGEM